MEYGSKYYFEIKVDKGKLLKIGIAGSEIEGKGAFSDGDHGWAIYNGELRGNGSVIPDQKYGLHVASGDVIGVMLDMVNGTLEFSKNGKPYGLAFSSE